ncbi:CGNR zinc finger domain-containing protein [Pendulispora albinea]|uniref:CGNR zinc finger domain-containing protein n=1 Tax=Pendulispora albinea TaxID=2741071 RepID=A0ABZ2LSX9_9BACT
MDRHVFEFLAGRVCLDFINTVSWRESETAAVERLTSYSEILAWAAAGGVLDRQAARRLRARALRHPKEAEAAHTDAVRFRDALYRTICAELEGAASDPADLAKMNARISEAAAFRRLVPSEAGFVWRCDESNLRAPLWTIALSAADLLPSPGFARVRRCGLEDCGWLFLDTSKNKTRRWCRMEICGNRHKAQRFYEKKKLRDRGTPPSQTTRPH